MHTYASAVLGCKVNDYEAAYVEQELNRDYRKVSFRERADIYIIFTCAVTNVAEGKSRKMIHQARRLNPEAFIVAVGCYAQTGPAEAFTDVDLLIGSTEKKRIKELIDERYAGSLVRKMERHPVFETMPLLDYSRKERAFLKIQDGCDQYCSYCIIPYARGGERSAAHEQVLDCARALCEHTSEIVLTGIHTGRYYDGEYHLIDLIRELVKIEGLKTLRLSSIEITEIHDDLIELYMTEEKMAHHLHIPLQSGSNKVLKEMNRPYTTEEFLQRITEIRERVPGISISTDLISGFPGESEEDQQETLQTLEKAQFSFIHLFPYARKKGTVADRRRDFVAPAVVKERIAAINELEAPIKEAYAASFLGKEVTVFIERSEKGRSEGYCREYLYTVLPEELPVGSLQRVKVREVRNGELYGEVRACC